MRAVFDKRATTVVLFHTDTDNKMEVFLDNDLKELCVPPTILVVVM